MGMCIAQYVTGKIEDKVYTLRIKYMIRKFKQFSGSQTRDNELSRRTRFSTPPPAPDRYIYMKILPRLVVHLYFYLFGGSMVNLRNGSALDSPNLQESCWITRIINTSSRRRNSTTIITERIKT